MRLLILICVVPVTTPLLCIRYNTIRRSNSLNSESERSESDYKYWLDYRIPRRRRQILLAHGISVQNQEWTNSIFLLDIFVSGMSLKG